MLKRGTVDRPEQDLYIGFSNVSSPGRWACRHGVYGLGTWCGRFRFEGAE